MRKNENCFPGCALDYLQLLKNSEVKMRFDIVEVLLSDGVVSEIRHCQIYSAFQSRIAMADLLRGFRNNCS
jgi:hypothetical protein